MGGAAARGRPAAFRTTRWSDVARAARADEPQARAALDELCADYWYPLYAFLRRRGHEPAEAEDLVQGFFARLLEKGWLGQADPARGRFRTFLLAALRHHVGHARERAGAKKRGGDRRRLPLEIGAGERRYAREDPAAAPADLLFEQQWARAVLDRAMQRLRAHHAAGPAGRLARFDALEPLLWGDGPPQREVAERLGIGETAVKVALHRLRRKLGEAVRAEVARTLDDPADIEGEIRHLIAHLRP